MLRLIKYVATLAIPAVALTLICVELYQHAPVLVPMAYAEAHGTNRNNETVDVADATMLPQVQTGIPNRIIIPKISLDKPIVEVGYTATGNMGVPANSYQAGWFAPGTRPGMRGNAVLAGHWKWNGGAGVFANLSKLSVGDNLFIHDDQGVQIQFKVVRIKLIDAETPRNELDDIFGPTDGYHLNLITCAGAWDPSINTYRLRLIVFAERV